MKIAFDVDGIITNLQNFEIREGKKYFNDEARITNPNFLNFKDLFNCTKKEEDDFWLKNIWKYSLAESPRKDIVNVINSLKQQGNEIYLITARVHTTEHNVLGTIFRRMLTYWLKKNSIAYDKMIFCDDKTSNIKKVNACIENNIDLIIDDEPKNIESLKEITSVGYIIEDYNKNCNGNNIYRLDSAKDILHLVSDLNKNNNKMYYKEGK